MIKGFGFTMSVWNNNPPKYFISISIHGDGSLYIVV